jgi:hypothetical protein
MHYRYPDAMRYEKVYCNSTLPVLWRLPADNSDRLLRVPRFFEPVVAVVLLSAALRKLDAAETRAWRKRRQDFLASLEIVGQVVGNSLMGCIWWMDVVYGQERA